MEKIISVYWFVILIIVAGGIVFMVAVFYGKPYDVRELEANILIGNIADCISQNGRLVYPVGSEELKNNFRKICHINFKTQDEEIQYYIELTFYDFNNQNKALDYTIKEGNLNLKNNPNTKSLFSTTKSLYVLNQENQNPKEILVKISVVISKTKENG
jgi:hypothetical protein